MSEVSSKAEHLIRAALKGIEKNPGSWNQDHWICTPEDAKYFRDRGHENFAPECGTAYCLGGWMMLYDGWRHEAIEPRPEWQPFNLWAKGDMKVRDPWGGFLWDLVYGEQFKIDLDDSIFAGYLPMDGILERIDEQLEINFEEDCPCLTEADVCNLQGCPCGTHTTALEVPASAFTPSYEVTDRVIERFVEDCRKAGDAITADMVRADKIIMYAFASMYVAGEDSMVHTVTQKANRRINELRVRLEGEIREITQSRDRLVARNSELQQSNDSQILRDRITRQATTIRKLQGQVDELHAGTRNSPEFVKLKAKAERLEEENQKFRLNNLDLGNRLEGARRELHAQKQANVQVQQIGRREGFMKAMGIYTKAIEIARKEEGL